MPFLVLPVALLVGLALVALLPFSLVQRYRVGTARRRARGWFATLNVVGFGISIPMFVAASAVTNLWAPGTLANVLLGLAAGGALGVLGLLATRWEPTPDALHFTPNRLLVLAITLLVAARLAYGFWSAWARWQASPGDASWMAYGAAGSLAAGAVVLGYYAMYWAGVRVRLARHVRRHGVRVRRW